MYQLSQTVFQCYQINRDASWPSGNFTHRTLPTRTCIYIYIYYIDIHRLNYIPCEESWFSLCSTTKRLYIYIHIYIYMYIYIWCILVPTRGTVDLDHEVWDDAMELAALGRGLCLIWIVFTQIIQNNNCNSKRYQLTKWGFWTKITQFTEQRYMYINICIIIYI